MNRPEAIFQEAVIKYLRHALPETALFSGVDHATKSASEGERKKKQGVIRGLPDVMIWWAGRFYGLELKAGRNDATDEQKDVGAAIKRNGFQWDVFWCIEDIETWLRNLGVPLRATTMSAATADARIAAKAAAPRKPGKPRAMSEPTPSEKWLTGHAAFSAGKSLNANPYSFRDGRGDWNEGWMTARREASAPNTGDPDTGRIGGFPFTDARIAEKAAAPRKPSKPRQRVCAE